MADFDGIIDPAAAWADIPQLSVDAVALGGAGGPMNAQALAITKRMKVTSGTGAGVFNVADPQYAGGASPSNTPVQNSAAFAAVSAAIMSAGRGKLFIPPSDQPYILGGQTIAGSVGKGYAFQMLTNIDIRNCPGDVVIEGYGAKLKLAPGLKFGSFDPVTGASAPNGSVNDNAADAGILINVMGNKSVVIRGVELDGNSSTLILGGTWGGTGYQRYAYGLRAYNNESVSVYDVYTHHNGTDGYVLGWEGTTASMPSQMNLMINVRSEYNSRQGFSWVGGVGLTAINCKFNYTGRGAFVSAPGAGIDIEAEGAVMRRGLFINCECGGNASTGLVGDSGDSAEMTFMNCNFYGTNGYAVWPRKPGYKFIGCLFAGSVVNTYTATRERDRTRFTDCLFSADESFDGVAAQFGSYLTDVGGQNPVFDNCRFITNNPLVRLPNSTVGATYRDCTLLQNGSTDTATPRGTFEGTNTITLSTGSADMSGSVVNGRVLTSGSIVGVIVGASGELPYANAPMAFSMRAIGSNGAIYLESSITWGNSAPTSGARLRGDRHFNNNPTVGQPKDWICTVSGSPGTWVSTGNL